MDTQALDATDSRRATPAGRRIRLDQVPVYVREGAILPDALACRTVRGRAAGQSARYSLLSRPGRRSSALSGRRNQHSRGDGGRLSYDVDQPARRGRRYEHSRAPPSRWLHAARTVLSPSIARVRGAEVGDRRRHARTAVASVAALVDAPEDAYLWDERLASTVVKVFDCASDVNVTVLFEA